MEKILFYLIPLFILFERLYCELDIDECSLMPKICNHGVCVNAPGSYQCYCRPGYTGDSCEQDIDECLSSPCKNGGSCQNLENNYECDCPQGFQGKDCSTNINECESNPCRAGSTCVDGIASYTCVCQEGLTGTHCELDIDDCESAPCQHGGKCVDALNGYLCECAGTGHAGPDCSLNIDECAPQPCQHGAACVDDVNDYRCMCHPGYTGKNCETDLNECESMPCQHGGVCLERSNVSLYRDDASALQVGPQPEMLLPPIFYEPFAYENASGYSCVCVSGTLGTRCEVNVDECASSPCAHGACVDAVGSFLCECSAGYEGERCDQEIDECLRYRPCVNGRCYDRRAAYYCACAAGWGGRNCSVVLEGCRDEPCLNNGTCLPWLYNETEHRFNCSCAPGHAGQTCHQITTMSLEKSSYAEVNTSRDEGYDISFRFKTTLGNGLLAMGRGLTYFFLELSNGRLNLHSSLLNKWEGVFIGSGLNDSNWQKVFVTINSSHVVLAANEEQTIYPISMNEAYNSSVTSFQSTRLGTAGSSYATLTHGPNFFVGCFQDVVVNGLWVLPEDANSTEPDVSMLPADYNSGLAAALLQGVTARCPRQAQCEPNPCRSGGVCEDAWTAYTCTCPRPTLGHTCQYNYTAATFGHESATPHSIVTVTVHEATRRAVHAALDISMFIRTRKSSGQIFYLGSGPRYGQTDETLVGASLKGGELLVHLRFNQTPEEYTVGGTRLDNGLLHLIEVVRNSTLVQVKLNGTEYFRKSISAAKQLDAQVLYLGGPPPPAVPGELPAASPAATPAPPTSPAPPADDDQYFKGVIQDVQISNGVNVTVVEFFPLRAQHPTLATPPPFGRVSLPVKGVLAGVVSDDACAPRPCLHDAVCSVTWNDFTCTCPRGYKGKTCSEVEFCQLQGCPLNSHCKNLDGGYECVSNATFDGLNTTLTYQLRVPRSVPAAPPPPPPPPHTIDITYRTKWGGTILEAWLGEVPETAQSFTVAAFDAQVTAHWRLGAALHVSRRFRQPPPHDAWRQVRFVCQEMTLTAYYTDGEGREAVGFTAPVDSDAWQLLMTEGHVSLGGPRRLRPRAAATTTTTTVSTTQTESATDVTAWEYLGDDDPVMVDSLGKYFKGCLGAVHVGGLLLPFFTEEELFVGAAATLLASQPHYALLSGRPWGAEQGVGCVLCLEQDCAHGGHCTDVRHSYTCSCVPGRTGSHCEIDIDECANHQCQNGATCQDGLAAYTCVCVDGYEGEFCELDIDECASSPCGAGATCTDLPGGFTCLCPAGSAGGGGVGGGQMCAPRPDCSAQACPPTRGLCDLTPPDPPNGNNYTCRCFEGFEGVHCEHAFCEVKPCVHGQCVVTETEMPFCQCSEGYTGQYCGVEVEGCAAGTCLHGGRCLVDPISCDCSHTGYTGARCETDVDECTEGRVRCGPGECRNHEGGYTCHCAEGFCGNDCALLDVCFTAGEAAEGGVADGAAPLGPCAHGGRCEQRCTNVTDYVCHCVDGWGGRNCSQQVVSEAASGGGLGTGWQAALGAGAVLLLLALVAGGVALAHQARRQRATRGTYSPSGQEYCNPRAAGQPRMLQPPPEERLI